MSLMSALWTSYSGLQVSQLGTDVTANNIANVSNPSYTRQRIDVSARFSLLTHPGDIGTGAQVDQVIRVHDEFVYSRYRNAETNVVYQGFMDQMLTEVSKYLPDMDEVGIQSYLLTYFDAWQKLSANPTESSQKIVVAEAAKNLTNSLQTARSQLTELQGLIDTQILSVVDEVNKLAKEIAEINKKILGAEAQSYDHANELRDKRDDLELQLQKLTGAQILKTGVKSMTKTDINIADYDENYQILLGGFNIVNDISFHPIVASKAENSAGAQYNIYFQQRDMSLINISKEITNGKLGAMLDLRGRTFNAKTGEAQDGLLQDYKDRLDEFAKGIIQSTNQIYASSAKNTMTSNTIGSVVGLTTKQAKLYTIAELDDLLLNDVQAGKMTIIAYNKDGTRKPQEIVVNIDPSLMSLSDIADAINVELGARGYNAEAVVSGGQLALAVNTKSSGEPLGALLIADDNSLVTSALGMTSSKKLEIVDALNIPFDIENGSFTIGVYNTNGELIAEREIIIDKKSSNPLYSTLEGIAAQINMQQIDDNKDNDMLNDTDDYLSARFSGDRLHINITDQNSELFFNITNDTAGFAGAIGLNKFFDGSSAKDIALYDELAGDPALIQAYDLPVVGNNEIANAIQQMQYQTITFKNPDGTARNETIMQNYKYFAGKIAEDTATTKLRLETAVAMQTNIGAQYESISKVNIDEELTNLIMFQAGYSANAKVISTIQLMLDTLLNLKQ
ncbi:MAG: flagellar hook-associated protein FlgK [Helicobacteraceae bacterium]|jgi:flagellar hook-associated protein 1 FlgK|nr:flagellar hook-associated protein FlgK [Helicobacteraceae bacterium]